MGGRLPGFSEAPLVSSHPIGIRGLVFEQHRVTAEQMAAAPRVNTCLDLHVGGPQAVEVRAAADEAWHKGAASTGSLTVTPAGAPYNVRWEGQRDLLLFAIDLETCRQYLPERLPRGELRVRAVINGDDPQLFHMARAFQAEAEAGCPTGSLYADSLAAAFVASFLDRYVEQGEDEGSGLTAERLRRVQRHVQEHLEEDLSVAALAALVHTSPFHFSRQFKQSTGQSPHQYVLQRRLDKARRLLESPGLSIAEVAYATGFPSQAHFTKVFGKAFGATPKAWRTRYGGR
ncbi:MAG: helix-turn-helix transcriptional regulator [Bryobacterales bacterium]|nr:helix-turn-helix transcriptional regulator [Bryobacterales bacterium]